MPGPERGLVNAAKPVIFNEEFQNELSFSQNWVAMVGSALSQSATAPS